ncbi:MAG: ATP-binding protein, partial [Bacteriovoracaceae bacterium]
KNKSQEGLKNLQKTLVDPVKLFFDSLDNVRPLIQEKNIKVKFTPKEVVPELPLDRNKIFQVFSNLLSNAIKFTPPAGEIIFNINWDEENFYFVLTDTGRGLPAGEEEKVFDKYWTGKKSKGSGTGLGLFICKSIIEAHGGAITCENIPGKGASFQFRIPRGHMEKLSEETGDVFVIDDDEDLCEVMSWSMKKEGLSVRSFSSGSAALDALARSRAHPSCLIVDFHLGDMDGCEFLRRKKSLGDCTPVILVSGSPDEVKCVAPPGEFVSIVEKPLDLEGLLREVRNLSGPYSEKSASEASTHSSHGPSSVQ